MNQHNWNLKSLYLAALIVIASVYKFQLSNGFIIPIYSATICSILYIWSQNPNHIVNKFRTQLSRLDKSVIGMVALFSVYLIVDTLYTRPDGIVYSLEKVTPLITFSVLIVVFKNDQVRIDMISNFVYKILFASLIFAFLMYHLHYTNVYISTKGIVKFNQLVSPDGAKNLDWLFSHKSRFAAFCMIALIFCLNKLRYGKRDIRRVVVAIVFLLLIIINIYYSYSLTFLAISVLYTLISLFIIYRRNINVYLRPIVLLLTTSVLFFVSIALYSNLESSRNVATLGDRSYIWAATIKEISSYPMGRIYISPSDLYQARVGLDVASAQNVYLTEMLEDGIVGGVLFCVIVILALINVYRNNNVLYLVGLLGILIGGMFDIVLSEAMKYVFWYVLAIWYSDVKRHTKEKGGIQHLEVGKT